ncbi:MAG TPA: hypothetical protein VM182_10335 [Terriglobia bacterium]|nr:hypothetical protein [Terriglobia bacterium]
MADGGQGGARRDDRMRRQKTCAGCTFGQRLNPGSRWVFCEVHGGWRGRRQPICDWWREHPRARHSSGLKLYKFITHRPTPLVEGK